MEMFEYQFSFDLNTKKMDADGVKYASVYNTEIKNAFNAIGFSRIGGSVYHGITYLDESEIWEHLRNTAPNLIRYGSKLNLVMVISKAA